jgi:DNA-directed RNA polymerase subunit RPC12/RpoP
MIALSRCERCEAELTIEQSDAGKTIDCPYCGKPTYLTARVEIRMADEIKATAKPTREEIFTPKDFLNLVRGKTCYTSIRAMASVFFFAAMCLVGLVAILSVWTILKWDALSIMSAVFSLVWCAMAIAAAFIGREAMLVGVDIADTVIRPRTTS